jgi:hypothetical protein
MASRANRWIAGAWDTIPILVVSVADRRLPQASMNIFNAET